MFDKALVISLLLFRVAIGMTTLERNYLAATLGGEKSCTCADGRGHVFSAVLPVSSMRELKWSVADVIREARAPDCVNNAPPLPQPTSVRCLMPTVSSPPNKWQVFLCTPPLLQDLLGELRSNHEIVLGRIASLGSLMRPVDASVDDLDDALGDLRSFLPRVNAVVDVLELASKQLEQGVVQELPGPWLEQMRANISSGMVKLLAAMMKLPQEGAAAQAVVNVTTTTVAPMPKEESADGKVG